MSSVPPPKDRNFTKLRNEIVDDGWLTVLSYAELRVYLVLARFLNKKLKAELHPAHLVTSLSGFQFRFCKLKLGVIGVATSTWQAALLLSFAAISFTIRLCIVIGILGTATLSIHFLHS